MILADKIILLRQKNGWSQEELAEKLMVSGLSVTQWENTQSVPDYETLIRMSQIFGVSTDYLLKDDYEEPKFAKEDVQAENLRRVSMEEANGFLAVKKWSAMKIAFATFLCIISPACLIFLAGAEDMNLIQMTENVASGLGVIVLLVIVAVATAIFLNSGNKTRSFQFLENEVFETEKGVADMVKERQMQFQDTYNRYNIIGTCLCILSAIPIFTVALTEENEAAVVLAVPVTLLLVGIGVICFIKVGIPWASMKKLLQEGDYTAEAKQQNSRNQSISTTYWLIATAIYLVYSFISEDWHISWIVWPIAGILYPILISLCNIFRKK